MEFREKESIYLQITDFACEQILLQKWKVGEKIISIRELAIEMQVNPNTVQRSYDFLQQKGIIATRRGLGYFVSDNAIAVVLAFKKERFLQTELPRLLHNMHLLKIDMKEIELLYKQYTRKHSK